MTAGTNPGLKGGAPLADAAAGKGGGTTTLGAGLDLQIPFTTPAGNYAATLTVTLRASDPGSPFGEGRSSGWGHGDGAACGEADHGRTPIDQCRTSCLPGHRGGRRSRMNGKCCTWPESSFPRRLLAVVGLSCAVAVAAPTAAVAQPSHTVTPPSNISWSVAPSSAKGSDGRTHFNYTNIKPGSVIHDYVGITNFSSVPVTFQLYGSDGITTTSGSLGLSPSYASRSASVRGCTPSTRA